ncbi:helix-turn-helix transcriptional regulator [Bacillus infantis]|uniref:helix-turn-helix domain-containing protein n=1 Tax=Bacillus infantis TaxID=324767 RepID=UPI001CD47747|nr:helix-turn-helix transcriptional regulator [Bacillus infantis]MCA1041522.1 helix-turn-helix transcriptional regulator [Bacillus infantis]
MLSTRIKKLRKEQNLSLSQLALRTKISKSYLSNIERGVKSNPSIEILSKISLALGVSITALYGNSQNLSENHRDLPLDEWIGELRRALEAGESNQQVIRRLLQDLEALQQNFKNSGSGHA